MPFIDINLILGLASALLLFGLIAFFAFLVRHQEQVEPDRDVLGLELLEQHYEAGQTVEQPTPYYVAPIPAAPDPLEISSNLDKKILLGGAMLFGLFGMVGAYFLLQPALRAEATEHQLSLDIRRGKIIYASLCYDCHGRDGKAGVNPEGKQLPGLPLNKPEFKHEAIKDDPAKLESTRRLIVTTIERGRPRPAPAYSMPAWARHEGGPLSPWQVKQVADLIMYGTDEDWADIVHVRTTHEPPGPLAEQIPPPPAIPSGRDVAQQVCTVCHSFTADRPSTNPTAPNLANFSSAGPTIAELRRARDSGDPDWLTKWVVNPQTIKPGSAMPPYGASAGGQLNDEQVKKVVDFLLGRGE